MAATNRSSFAIDSRKEILLVYQPVFSAFTCLSMPQAISMGRLVEANELHKYVKRLVALCRYACFWLAIFST